MREILNAIFYFVMGCAVGHLIANLVIKIITFKQNK
jgi:hypothetical protein